MNTQEELREEYTKWCYNHSQLGLFDNASINADFWLSKFKDHNEKLIKVIKGMIKAEGIVMNNKVFGGKEFDENKLYNAALKDILSLLDNK